jgi:hypothetical protein
MSYDDELNWLRDRGVHVDHKGRIIVSLPVVPDDVDFDVVEREPSVAELMRREINPRLAGSHGRRRRRLSTPVQRNPGATRIYQQPAMTACRPADDRLGGAGSRANDDRSRNAGYSRKTPRYARRRL